MIVYLVSIILIVIGIYSMWTKNPKFAPGENLDSNYVQKIGIIYLAIGVVLFLLELINVIWMIPTIISILIQLCFLVPLLIYYHSLQSGMKQDNEV